MFFVVVWVLHLLGFLSQIRQAILVNCRSSVQEDTGTKVFKPGFLDELRKSKGSNRIQRKKGKETSYCGSGFIYRDQKIHQEQNSFRACPVDYIVFTSQI